jgi:hypothetical protein
VTVNKASSRTNQDPNGSHVSWFCVSSCMGQAFANVSIFSRPSRGKAFEDARPGQKKISLKML